MTKNARIASVARKTSESTVSLEINLDGTGVSNIATTVPFFDHMLTAFAKHSLTDLTVTATGDTEIDVHHTVEDTAIVLGQAIKEALGNKSGISFWRCLGAAGRCAGTRRCRHLGSPLPRSHGRACRI